MAFNNIRKTGKPLECVGHESRKGTISEKGKSEVKGQEESQGKKSYTIGKDEFIC